MSAAILVVDDDRPVRAIASLFLRREGYCTIEAASGEEALAICGVERVDLVLSDINMPGMSGLLLGREIRARHPRLPIVLMSGSEGKQGEAVLPKPFTQESLARAVRASLPSIQ